MVQHLNCFLNSLKSFHVEFGTTLAWSKFVVVSDLNAEDVMKVFPEDTTFVITNKNVKFVISNNRTLSSAEPVWFKWVRSTGYRQYNISDISKRSKKLPEMLRNVTDLILSMSDDRFED